MTTVAKKVNICMIMCLLAIYLPFNVEGQNEKIKEEIRHHNMTIKQAFAEGDIEKIRSVHHPDVVKALGYNDLKVGRDEVINGLKEILQNYHLEFIENHLENSFIKDSIVIHQGLFSLKGIPKKGGEPFIFKGRTMVVYMRYDKSPTGWATIREMIQPAVEKK